MKLFITLTGTNQAELAKSQKFKEYDKILIVSNFNMIPNFIIDDYLDLLKSVEKKYNKEVYVISNTFDLTKEQSKQFSDIILITFNEEDTKEIFKSVQEKIKKEISLRYADTLPFFIDKKSKMSDEIIGLKNKELLYCLDNNLNNIKDFNFTKIDFKNSLEKTLNLSLIKEKENNISELHKEEIDYFEKRRNK